MIPRLVQESVMKAVDETTKIVLLLGPRQAGKTTLLQHLAQEERSRGKRTVYLNCDVAEDLSSINTTAKTTLAALVGRTDLLLIDEAQRLDDPGLTLKILHDQFPRVRVIATGSSSFDLKSATSEAMTGRYLDFTLYPLSFAEIARYQKPAEPGYLLPDLLLYGGYPDIYLEAKPGLKRTFLEKIVESYLFRDVLALRRVRNPKAAQDLARALAYQIGSEVNENELASRVGIDRKTLISYLDVLEKAFVIVRLYPYARNLRREIGRRYKVYFVDVGVRNALIGDFNALALRSDAGALWENFLVMERRKRWASEGKTARSYFWRNYNGAEVDYLEIEGPSIRAWEFKSGVSATLGRGAASFRTSYHTPVSVVDRGNFRDFIE